MHLNMDQLTQYLPFLIPLVAIQLVLAVVALVHVFRHTNYRFGNRVLWVIIIVLGELIGPILYLTVGRGDD